MGIYLVLAIVVIVLLAVFTYRLASKSKSLKTTLNISYSVVIVILAYFLFVSIMKPIKFEKVKKFRYEATIVRLKKIRDVEDAYKSVYGKYIGNIDSLVDFGKSDSLIIIKAIGMVPDSLAIKFSAEKAEQIALKAGIITRDTSKVAVRDSLFKDMQPDSMVYVPFVGKKFHLGAGILVTMSQTKEPVFEAKASNDVILAGLNRQMIVNLNDERKKNDKYPGLKVGSLTELVRSGNWE